MSTAARDALLRQAVAEIASRCPRLAVDIAAVLDRRPRMEPLLRHAIVEQDALLLVERLLGWTDASIRDDLGAYVDVTWTLTRRSPSRCATGCSSSCSRRPADEENVSVRRAEGDSRVHDGRRRADRATGVRGNSETPYSGTTRR